MGQGKAAVIFENQSAARADEFGPGRGFSFPEFICFALKVPDQVSLFIPREHAFPYVALKADSAERAVTDWDLLFFMDNDIPGLKPVPYVPFLERAKVYLECESVLRS